MTTLNRAVEFRGMAVQAREGARLSQDKTARLAFLTLASDYDKIAATLDSIDASKAALEKDRPISN